MTVIFCELLAAGNEAIMICFETAFLQGSVREKARTSRELP
jgi:hypothetical protein